MNVLILTGRFGMGHYSAATTLAQDIQKQYPAAAITVRDIFEEVTPRYYQSFYNCYTWIVNKASVFYNTYYRITECSRQNVRPPVMYYLFHVLERLLNRVNPDLVFSTLPLCSQLVSQYKKRYPVNFPLITCITDISSHNEWINDCTDYYMVGSVAVKEELMLRKVPENKIYITGIPVKRQFKEVYPVHASSKRHLLIMGGGLGLIPKNQSFYEQLNDLENVRTTIILGNNKKLYEELHGMYENIEVVGYTDRVYEYMRQADALLSKPGGITMFETIYSGLPIIVLHPFLEQEIKNAKFIDRQGLGYVLWNKDADPVDGIRKFMSDPELRIQIQNNMEQFKKSLEIGSVRKIVERSMEHAPAMQKPLTFPCKGVVLS